VQRWEIIFSWATWLNLEKFTILFSKLKKKFLQEHSMGINTDNSNIYINVEKL
jgi:hypothetical protein